MFKNKKSKRKCLWTISGVWMAVTVIFLCSIAIKNANIKRDNEIAADNKLRASIAEQAKKDGPLYKIYENKRGVKLRRINDHKEYAPIGKKFKITAMFRNKLITTYSPYYIEHTWSFNTRAETKFLNFIYLQQEVSSDDIISIELVHD